MAEFLPGCDAFITQGSSADILCDPSKRRDHYRQLMYENAQDFDLSHISDIHLWLQDSWSEIRKDCARWIRSRLNDISPDSEKLLLSTLIDCIRSGSNSWQAVHGSLLGITEMIQERTEVSVCNIVRTLCLGLVGSNLAPVREAASSCVSKLVASGQISTAALISTILSSITSLHGNGEDMVVANELDGLLGCVCDTIRGSIHASNSNMLSIFKMFDEEFKTSSESQEKDSKEVPPLLTRVIRTVDLLMGHSSSIVRQHASQVFLNLYYLLPEENDQANSSSNYRQSCYTFISDFNLTITAIDQGSNSEVAAKYIVMSRGGMLRIIANAVLDIRKWQRQEVCLIISEEILQKVLLESLETMSKKSWSRFSLSDSLHILLATVRNSSCSSFLHPLFEIRRMHGQVLPAIARATIIFQPEMLLDEMKVKRLEFDESIPTLTGLGHLMCPRSNPEEEEDLFSYDLDQSDVGTDCKAIVLCVWVSSLCNAAEHICELDSGCGNFKEALLRKGVSSVFGGSSFSVGNGTVWAMEVAGRHSEELSKKQYSSALKAVLSGGNVESYSALADSLSCVKTLLSETFHIFWSPQFVASKPPSSSSSGVGRCSTSDMRKVHLPDTVSCDFIDAAALSAVLLQKLDPEMFERIASRGLHEIGEDSNPNGKTCLEPDIDAVSVNIDDEGDNKNGNECASEACLNIPVFLFCMRAIMRAGRELSNAPQALSRGSSCRSTPASSPMKSFHPYPCRIDMSCYGAEEHQHGRSKSNVGILPRKSSEKSSGDTPGSESSYLNINYNRSTSDDIFDSGASMSSPTARRRHSVAYTLSPHQSPTLRRLSLTLPRVSERTPNRSSSQWMLLPSLTDPSTDLSKGLLRVDSSALAAHRWLCESLAPLLPCLVSALSPLGCAVLAPVVADWALCIASNSLWMDGRILARKALCSSLPLLVEKASPLLLRPIELSDRALHTVAMRQTVVSQSVEEQVYAYLSETTITCIVALSAETPGLDPYSAGCLLRTLRLCRVQSPKDPEVEDPVPNTLHGTSSLNLPGLFSEKAESDTVILLQLRDAMTAYTSKHCVRAAWSSDADAVPSSAMACSRSIDFDYDADCQESSHLFESVEGDDDDFSDWDEEDDSEVACDSRKGSFCLSDDVAILEEEIELLNYMINT